MYICGKVLYLPCSSSAGWCLLAGTGLPLKRVKQFLWTHLRERPVSPMANQTAPHLPSHLSSYFLSTQGFSSLQEVSIVPVLPNHFSHWCLEAFSATTFFHFYCHKWLSKAETYYMAAYSSSYSLLSPTFCPCMPTQKKPNKALPSATFCYHTHSSGTHPFFTFSNYQIIESALPLGYPNPWLMQGRRKVQVALRVWSEIFSNHSTHMRAKDRAFSFQEQLRSS